MSNQNEIIKQKLNNVFTMYSSFLETLNIDAELEMNEETGVQVISFAADAEEITSYPVVSEYSAVVDEKGVCTLLGHIILSFQLKTEKIKEIRAVVNELNKSMVLGTIVRNPEENSLHYNYKCRINDVENKDEEKLFAEIAEKINMVVNMAAQILAIIEKNEYDAEYIYDDSEDEEDAEYHNTIDEYLKKFDD